MPPCWHQAGYAERVRALRLGGGGGLTTTFFTTGQITTPSHKGVTAGGCGAGTDTAGRTGRDN